MFVPRGDRDLGVAYQTHPGNQASSQGEAKNSAVLLGRDGFLLEPTVCPKGSQASCGVWIELTAAAAALIEVKVCTSWHTGTGKPAARSVYVFQFICGNSNLQCDGVSGWGSLGCDWIMKVEPS